MVQESDIKLDKKEAENKAEVLRREIITMEWDIEHHGLKLKQDLYDKKKEEFKSIMTFLNS